MPGGAVRINFVISASGRDLVLPERAEGSAGTETRESMVQLRIFLIRAALGAFFAYFLARFFIPSASPGLIVVMAALLVFFAYVFEGLRKR